eukprot:scaffold19.g1862.t1
MQTAESTLERLEQLPSARLPTAWDGAAAALRPLAQAAAVAAACAAIHSFGAAARVLGSLAVAAGMAGAGWRRGALDGSGAAAALGVGWATLGASFRGGLTLLAFFFVSSFITRLGDEDKALDEEHRKGGQRNWVQVLCNGVVPAALALAAAALTGGGLDLPVQPLAAGAGRAAAALTGAFLGYYACCCGDTWASELGQLSPEEPRLITTLRPVRRGTNGGVTLLGLAASLAGGLFVGAVFCAAGAAAPAAAAARAAAGAGPAAAQWRLVPLGLAAGLVGSLVDSLLGATVQFSGYNRATGKITSRRGPDVTPISGLPILDNNVLCATLINARRPLADNPPRSLQEWRVAQALETPTAVESLIASRRAAAGLPWASGRAERPAAPPPRTPKLRPSSIEELLRPSAVLPHISHTRLQHLILAGKLAPCWRTTCAEEDGDECLICYSAFPTINQSSCCAKEICTECFLRCVCPRVAGRAAVCPFCKTDALRVVYRGRKPEAQRRREREEEARVEAALRRALLAARQGGERGQQGGRQGEGGAPAASAADEEASTEHRGEAPLSAALGERLDSVGVAEAGACGRRSGGRAASSTSSAATGKEGERAALAGKGSGAAAAGAAGKLPRHCGLGAASLKDSAGALSVCWAGCREDGAPLLGLPLRLSDTLAAMSPLQHMEVVVGMVLACGAGGASAACQRAAGQRGAAERAERAVEAAGRPAEPAATVPEVAAPPLEAAAPPAEAVGAGQPGGEGAASPALPEQRGPAILVLPDGSQQLMLLTSDAAAEAAAEAQCSAQEAHQGEEPAAPTYQAPMREYDARARAAIAAADAALRHALQEPRPPGAASGAAAAASPLPTGEAPPPAGASWLARMQAADAALRRAVQQADEALR